MVDEWHETRYEVIYAIYRHCHGAILRCSATYAPYDMNFLYALRVPATLSRRWFQPDPSTSQARGSSLQHPVHRDCACVSHRCARKPRRARRGAGSLPSRRTASLAGILGIHFRGGTVYSFGIAPATHGPGRHTRHELAWVAQQVGVCGVHTAPGRPRTAITALRFHYLL